MKTLNVSEIVTNQIITSDDEERCHANCPHIVEGLCDLFSAKDLAERENMRKSVGSVEGTLRLQACKDAYKLFMRTYVL